MYISSHKLQAKESSGQLMVNFDPVLHKVVSEAYHLSRPPTLYEDAPYNQVANEGHELD